MVTCRYSEIERFYPEFRTHGGTVDADSEMFARLFNEKVGSRGLEIGANKEPLAVALGNLGYDITGVDLRPYDPYEDTRYYLPKFDFIQGDFLEINLWAHPTYSFDFIYCISTIEHIGLGAYGERKVPDGDVLAMDKIRSHLRPHGHVYLSFPAGHWEEDPRGWRVYSRDRLRERLKYGFETCSETFVAADVFGGYARGDLISEDEAFSQHGPQASCLLVLEKV